jgi:hypothetical protein
MKRTIEALNHFRCEKCEQWFSIGDAPVGKEVWYCPWCGEKDTAKPEIGFSTLKDFEQEGKQ